MKQPIESDYTSQVAYTRALEEYCDWLVQTAQEPCGWQFYQDGKWHNGMETNNHRSNTDAAGVPTRNIYPDPPAAQRQWVGLTPEEIYDCDEANACRSALAYAIETKLKEKNT